MLKLVNIDEFDVVLNSIWNNIIIINHIKRKKINFKEFEENHYTLK